MSAVTYAQTLKPAAVETPLDLAFFRPAAWRAVQLALPTRMTANQMTGLSIVAGLAGAALLASPRRDAMALSALFSVLYGVLDCADGQLARARGTSSRLGRVLDGMSDYLVGGASGVAISLHLGGVYGPWGYAFGAGGFVSVMLQGTLFDHFKNRYLTRAASRYREGDDLAETLEDLAALRASGGSPFSVALLSVYALFLRVQSALGGARREAPLDPSRAERYATLLRPIARGWAWLGPSTHVFVMGLALLGDVLAPYVALRLTLGNVAMLGLLLAQRAREREVSR